VPPALTVIVTGAELVVTTLPDASFTATTGCVVNATPLAAPAAGVVNASCAAAPAVIVTVAGLPVTAMPPIVTPIVGVPAVDGAVYVAVQTPLTQVKAPIDPALGVATNTADVAPVSTLPNASFTVTVTVAAPPGESAVGLTLSVDVVAFAAAPPTVTLKRSPPAALSVPSVAATTATSVFTRIIGAVATPFVNVTLVAAPNAVATTVGAVLEGATLAPLNVRLFAPV
jgi:hypothetical protein